MDYYDLKPTEENLVKVFKNDTLGRNAEMLTFLRILDTIDENYTISLDAPWGSGKTFFVKQAQMIFNGSNAVLADMDEKDNSNEKKKEIANAYRRIATERFKLEHNQLAIYFDAWAYDDFDEPVLAIVYDIIQQLDLSAGELSSLNVVEIVASLIGLIADRDIISFASSLKPEDLLENVKKHKDAREKIDAFFNNLMEERGDRCVIFIDELDRCNPVFAVKLLERIKHYFTSDRITFVFSTNISELANTIRCQYGEQFDAGRYLDRFFDLRLALHAPQDLRPYLVNLGFNNNRLEDELMLDMVEYCHFSLREINHYFSIMHIANGLHRDYRWEHPGKVVIHQCIVPILLALKLWNADQYGKFITGENEDLFVDLGYKYLDQGTINSFLSKDKKPEDSKNEATLKLTLKTLYHSLFNKDYLNVSDYHVITVGRVMFDQNDIDEIRQTVDILSGTPSIDQVKKKNELDEQ